MSIWRAGRVHQPEAHRQAKEVGVVMNAAARAPPSRFRTSPRRPPSPRRISSPPRRTAGGTARRPPGFPVLAAQPRIKPRRVARAQDHDLIFTDRELRLDFHAEVPAAAGRIRAVPEDLRRPHEVPSELRRLTRGLFLRTLRRAAARPGDHVIPTPPAGASSRSPAAIQPAQGPPSRKSGGRALAVVLHRQDGARVLAHQDDLRRVIKSFASALLT